MYNLQWLKIDANLFANRKIQILLKEPDGDTYIRVWIQLLSISLECNKDGKLLIGENKPMSIEYFSKIMGKSYEKMKKIIGKFLELEMIILENEVYKIKNWNEYQSIQTYEKYKEQGRLRQQKYREKKKSEKEKSDVTVTLRNGEEENKEKNKDEIFHNKCKFCGKDLKPIGLDYLYANISLSSIEYERCNCKESKAYWKEIDLKEEIQRKRKHFEQIIRQFYIQNYSSKRIQDYQFETFIITENNEKEVEIAKDFTEKCINKNQKNGLIITGKSGVGKTHLAKAILNKLTEKDMLVLMGRLILLLDVIKDTFKDFSSKEKDIIELYSKVDMLIIDDLGTERISSWGLEKLYTIIENRNENKLPIIVTTRFNKESLLDRFYQSEDEELAEAVIEKLYQFCYGIELKKYDEYEKEKVSISD